MVKNCGIFSKCLQSTESEHLIIAEYCLKMLFVSTGYPHKVYYEGDWSDLIAASFCSTVLAVCFFYSFALHAKPGM